ncbi:MAG: PAS domain S-box protein [Acidobacteria bacterium]|nr:PAS domain S-box protein [Acidobacteriota bacterium]MBS1866009.1 PAS domain S-box protein [Acidobacteriota bacterium]
MEAKAKVRALSLRKRILLLTMLTTGVGLVLASAGYMAFDTHTAKEQKLKQLEITADLIGTNATASLAFDDSESAEKLLEVLKTQPEIRGAALYTLRGTILAAYDRPDKEQYTPPSRAEDGPAWGKDALRLATPVTLDGKRIGTIYLESDLKDLRERISRFEILTAKVAAGMLLLVYLVTTFLARSITRPIERLAALTRTIAMAKEYGFRAPLIGARELRHLAVDFNQMLGEIQRSERALMESRDTLELRVAERTKELEQEISEKRKAEQSLRESEETFRTVSEAAPVGIFRADTAGAATYMNQALLSLLAMDSESAKGAGWANAVHPEDIDALVRERRAAMQEGREYSIDYRVQRRDGSIRSAEVRAKPLKNESGEILGYVGVVQDYTERNLTEAKLREQSTYLTTLLNACPIGIVAENAEGQIELSNPAFRELFGYSMEEMRGKPIDDLIAPGELRRDASMLTKEVLNGNVLHRAVLRRHRSGLLVDVEVYGVPFVVDGVLRGQFVLYQDISERIAAQKALRQSEEMFRTLTAAAPVGIFRTDGAGNALYLNEKWLAMTGLTAEEAAGMGWEQILHPEDREHILPLWLDTCKRGAEFSASYRYVNRNSQTVWVETIARPVLGQGNNTGGYVGIVQDVTERIKRQEELRRSEEQFRTLSAVAPVGIVLLDEKGNFTYVNEQYLRMSGLTEAEAMRNEWRETIHPDDLEELNRTRTQMIAQQKDYAMSYRYLRRDKKTVWVDTVARSFRQKEKSKSGYVVVIQDVTERHHSEERLRLAKEAAEAANKAKSEFLANMSHEIRTPMNGILGMTELALDTDLHPDQREYLSMVRSSAEALLAIINDILDFSKIEAGKLELEEAAFSLEDCIEEALGPLGVRAMKKGLDLTWSTEGKIPEALKGDSTRLRQILINLVGNAIKFTKQGEVAVWARRISEEIGKVKIHFVVSDTGIGIPPEKHQQIFEAFSQADASTTREFGGTGLGLSISARLVRLMGGEIGLESTPGQGSKFHFTVLFEEARALERSLPVFAELKNTSVLVVDDNEVNRHLLKKLLRMWGMNPVLVNDGMAAIEEYGRSARRAAVFPLVLLDMNMPWMDGYQVATKLREFGTPEQTAIIILSSSFATHPHGALDSLGISRKLNKPIRRGELHDAIAQVLRKNNAPESSLPETARTASRNLRLLLVEDNLVNQKLAMRLLEKMGHEVKLAVNGKEAVEMSAEGAFDLILMDIQMPVMGGMEAARQIRERETNTDRRTPILAMTAHAMKGDEQRCLEGGMDGYVSKPIRIDLLRGEIERLTEKGQDTPIVNTNQPAKRSDEKQAPVNLQELLTRVENDWELLRDLTGILKTDFPRYAENMRAAIQDRDLPRAAESAHALKGMLSNLAAARAADAASEIEKLARGGGSPDFVASLSKFDNETQGIVEELEGHLAGVQK